MDRAKIVRLSEGLEKLLYAGIGLTGILLNDVVGDQPDKTCEVMCKGSERFGEIRVVARMSRKVRNRGFRTKIPQRHDRMDLVDAGLCEPAIGREAPHPDP